MVNDPTKTLESGSFFDYFAVLSCLSCSFFCCFMALSCRLRSCLSCSFLCCLSCCLSCSSILFAGEFTATVNRNQIHLEEGVILSLTLKDVAAKSAPSLQPLNASFVISSQQQSSNTVIHNGKVSSTVSWKLTLIPKKEGELQIPSLMVATAEGMLSSQPITIKVSKGTPPASPAVGDGEILMVTTEVSRPRPYKQEPIFYTIKLRTNRNIANVQIQKLEVENAIVEPDGGPKSYETTFNGQPIGVIEFNYMIIPLKAGNLKIPSVLVQGVVPMRKKQTHPSFFDDDDFNPFSILGGFDLLKPFVQMTDEVTVDVQPTVADMNPWIPAKSLKIEEVWTEPSLKVGEPFNREFKIVAEGVTAKQLPSLEEQQISDGSFKLYADKPKLVDDVKDKRVQSSRIEQYTYIPRHAGSFLLPEITIVWWDVVNQREVVARVPSRTVQVPPAPEQETQYVALATPKEEAVAPPTVQEQSEQTTMPSWYLILVLVAIALPALIVILRLFLKKNKNIQKPKEDQWPVHLTDPESTDSQPEEKNKKLPDLNPT